MKSKRKQKSVNDGVNKRKIEAEETSYERRKSSKKDKSVVQLPYDVIIDKILTYLPNEEEVINCLKSKLIDEKGILSIKHFSFNIHIKFGILIMFFLIYKTYSDEGELSLDLIKKLKVYYCMNPEKLQKELEDLIPLNEEIVANKEIKEKIKKKKEELEESVKNIELVKDYTEELDSRKINVLDCDHVSYDIIPAKIYVTKDQLRPEHRRVVLYGFETKITKFQIHNLVERIDYYYPSLEEIGNNWMKECLELRRVNFTGLPSLKRVGDNWMSYCGLKTVNFNGLSKLERVGDSWMFDSGLESPDFSDLSSLKTVGDGWMCGCNSLERPDFSGLSSLKKVGNFWMWTCENLKTPNFVGLSQLEKIGDYWMSECDSLERPNFNGLTKLETVGENWMAECDNLKTPNYNGMSSIQTIGKNWMKNCRELETPNFESLSKIERMYKREFIF